MEDADVGDGLHLFLIFKEFALQVVDILHHGLLAERVEVDDVLLVLLLLLVLLFQVGLDRPACQLHEGGEVVTADPHSLRTVEIAGSEEDLL